MTKKMNIAIDGPAGAGKSTVAKLVGEKLHYLYIDTGAMYRALTFIALEKDIDIEDGQSLRTLLDKIVISLKADDKGLEVYVGDNNVTEDIRSESVTKAVSTVAKHPEVRIEMLNQQRALAKAGGTVMDGRDIGTEVLPEAEVKIFLTASVEERAKRRYEEIIAKGQPANLQQLMREIAERDEKDMSRSVAPLKKAEDAIEIDSTHLSIHEVAEQIFQLVREKENGNGSL